MSLVTLMENSHVFLGIRGRLKIGLCSVKECLRGLRVLEIKPHRRNDWRKRECWAQWWEEMAPREVKRRTWQLFWSLLLTILWTGGDLCFRFQQWMSKGTFWLKRKQNAGEWIPWSSFQTNDVGSTSGSILFSIWPGKWLHLPELSFLICTMGW